MIIKWGKVVGVIVYLGKVIKEGRLSEKVPFESRLDLLRESVLGRSRKNVPGRMYRKFQRPDAGTNTFVCLRKSRKTPKPAAV